MHVTIEDNVRRKVGIIVIRVKSLISAIIMKH